MKIKTELLKELVTKSINGASNDKLIPITQLMSIQGFENQLVLITTDATNYFYVCGKDVDVKEFNVTVFAEQFAKLISKMTCKEIYLDIKDGSLEVKGNGTYTLELPLDENGELIKYPDPYADVPTIDFDGTIQVSKVKAIVDSIRPSLATTMELPSITNYFVGNSVVATDRYKIASYDDTITNDEILVSSQLMYLLALFEDKIEYKIGDNYMIFNSEDCWLYSKQKDDISEYPIEAINKLIDEDFKSVCKVNKNDFIALLERIALFVGKYDDKAVRLYFEKDGIRVSNKNRNSNELIEYLDSKKYKSYNCSIDVDMLLSQLKAYAGDIVELHYNNDKVIKFVDGSITQIIALMEE